MTEPNVLRRVLKASGALTRRRNKIRRGVYRMIHKEMYSKSGGYTLQKVTKTQVRNEIKHTGSFNGFMCGNRVNPSQIAEGWCLGVKIECETTEKFENLAEHFALGLGNHTPELGKYPHYYRIVSDSERNAHLRRQYARIKNG